MKSEIMRKIESGVFRIRNNRQSKSKIWNTFRQIENSEGRLVDGAVICKKCNHILKYNGKQTSNLIRHKCCILGKSGVPLKKVNDAEKEILLLACSQWILKDCRPFSIVDGEGFKKVVESLLSIGTKYGNSLDVSDMVPDSRMISRRINDMAINKRIEIKDELRIAIESGTASITSNLWTDNYVQRNFLCATFHFMKGLKLKEIVLGVKSVDFQKSTGLNVLTKLISILDDFEVHSMEHITFVTDRGSNIVTALEDQNRINCANLLLNNVLDSAFNSTNELVPFLGACKQLVKYLKKTSLQHMLSTSFQSYCITRWNSHFDLFQSIANNYFEIQEFLSSVNETRKISDINLSLLNALVKVFEKLDIISRKLQGVNYVTLNYVYLTINTLKTVCEESHADSPIIKSLKTHILREMETQYIPNLSILHYTACFLYPPTNSCLQDSKLNAVKDFCVSEIMKSVTSSDTSADSSTYNESPEDFQLFFSTLMTPKKLSMAESISEEINRYSYLKIGADVNFDVMQWWENHNSEYPRLYKFAHKILAIPASSAASERVFSAAGNIITEKRKHIGPKAVNNLLFLNSVYKYE